MIRVGVAAGLGLALGAGAGLVVGAPAERPPSRALTVLPRARPCPIAAADPELAPALRELAVASSELDQVEAWIAAVVGREVPWSEVAPDGRPDAVRAAVDALPPAYPVVAIDCETYPCIVVLELPEEDGCELRWIPLEWHGPGRSQCRWTEDDPPALAGLAFVDPERVGDDVRVEDRMRRVWARVSGE